MVRSRWLSGLVVATALMASGAAIGGEPPDTHQHDPNSPSDTMMEQCMGAERHRVAGEVIDRMHGEGAHDRMHQSMDRMMGMMGMMGGGNTMGGQGGMMQPRGRRPSR